ncbi:MAG: hypothetical protein EPO21_23070 [Chloroflexota bacterium]|nr:MAG: hypothetical protein EPO21_23070 [Chloroflexota bacterium]
MGVSKEDRTVRLDRVMVIDTKTMDLDRVLINLFMLLKHSGSYPVSRTGIVDRTPKMLADRMCSAPNFVGFAEHPDVVQSWLEADFLDLVNRGRENEALAAPRPVHLNAYKVRNARHCKDYGAAPQLYRLLSDENDKLPERLRGFLIEGCDPTTDTFQGGAVDLETLVVLRLADREGRDQPGPERAMPHAPLCPGQGRLLRNDIRRLLRYSMVIPRPVWVEYFKTLCGLHLALYVRRLASQIHAWMGDRSVTLACRQCPVDPTADEPLADCPFDLEFAVDMGDRLGTHMAMISQASAERHFAAMAEFVRDMMGLTKLIQFLDSTGYRAPNTLSLIDQALHVYATDDRDLRGYCWAKLNTIIGSPPDSRMERVRDDFRDDPFRAYVEAILLECYSFHRGRFRELFSSLLSPKHDTGMLVSGRTWRSPIRFHVKTRLLETLVQIAVLRPAGQDAAGQPLFKSEPMLVSDLLNWLRRRYGIGVGAAQLSDGIVRSPADLRALRENEESFKERLREIGFYTDLSDAYNAQRVSPRYRVGEQ